MSLTFSRTLTLGEHVGNHLSLGDAANLDFPVPGGLCLFKLEADRRGEF